MARSIAVLIALLAAALAGAPAANAGITVTTTSTNEAGWGITYKATFTGYAKPPGGTSWHEAFVRGPGAACGDFAAIGSNSFGPDDFSVPFFTGWIEGDNKLCVALRTGFDYAEVDSTLLVNSVGPLPGDRFDCKDFTSQAAAWAYNRWFKSDPSKLGADANGVPCAGFTAWGPANPPGAYQQLIAKVAPPGGGSPTPGATRPLDRFDAARAVSTLASRLAGRGQRVSGMTRSCRRQRNGSYRCTASWRTPRHRYAGAMTLTRFGPADTVRATLTRTARACTRAQRPCKRTLRRTIRL